MKMPNNLTECTTFDHKLIEEMCNEYYLNKGYFLTNYISTYYPRESTVILMFKLKDLICKENSPYYKATLPKCFKCFLKETTEDFEVFERRIRSTYLENELHLVFPIRVLMEPNEIVVYSLF